MHLQKNRSIRFRTGGYLTTENLLFGVRLGIVGIMGVIVAKIWLKKASKEVPNSVGFYF